MTTQDAFDVFLDQNVTNLKLRKLLQTTMNTLSSLQEVWMPRPRSKTLSYLARIESLFSLVIYRLFQDSKNGVHVLMAYYFYSQPIDENKIKPPRNLSETEKHEFQTNVSTLLTSWHELGQMCSYAKLKVIIQNQDELQKMESMFKSTLSF
jgi:hypothetical protein